MPLSLKLTRPLAIFDIESTGTNPRIDRIIDLAVIKVLPDRTREEHVFRVNPEVPIPPETTRIHGISDDDVRDAPSFSTLATQIAALLDDCDLGGFNILRFDLPLITAEFERAEIPFSAKNRRIIDMQRIFHIREPRDLTAALQFYCGEMHLGAHGAVEDTRATLRVLEGQYERYNDLPTDIDELHAFCNPRRPDWVDEQGRLKWSHGEVAINFGRFTGRTLRSLVGSESGYLDWILKGDFPDDTKAIVSNARAGQFPDPPESED